MEKGSRIVTKNMLEEKLGYLGKEMSRIKEEMYQFLGVSNTNAYAKLMTEFHEVCAMSSVYLELFRYIHGNISLPAKLDSIDEGMTAQGKLMRDYIITAVDSYEYTTRKFIES